MRSGRFDMKNPHRINQVGDVILCGEHKNKFVSGLTAQYNYGQQDKAERLLRNVFKGQPEKIQAALQYQGKFTDYSG
jgi:hypothetical protein